MQCRACRSFDCEDAAMNMSEVIPSDGKTLYDYFNDCTQLKASPDDHLPKILCINCVQSLQQAHTFRQEAHKSDEVLRQILPITKEEPASSDYMVGETFEEELPEEQEMQIQDMFTVIEEPPDALPKKGDFSFEDSALSQAPGSTTENETTLMYEVAEEQSDGLEDELDEISTYDPLAAYRRNSATKTATIAVVEEEQDLIDEIKEEIKIEDSQDMFEEYSDDDVQFEVLPSSYSDDTDENSDDAEFKRLNKRRFVCDYCVYRCDRLHILKEHIFELHKDEISCEKCSKVYDLPAEIKLHQKLAHGSCTRLRCNWCKDSEPLPFDELIKHLKNAHRSIYLKYFPRMRARQRADHEPFPCERCTQTFATIYELAEHKQEHNFNCPLCFTIFQKHSSYRTHVFRTHKLTLTELKRIVGENEEDEKEEREKKIVEDKEKLQQLEEQEIHKLQQQNKCPICFKEFNKRSAYSSHMIRTHNLTLTKIKEIIKGNEQKQAKQEDGKPTKKENEEEENSMQENKFECPLCLKGFQNVRSYRSHVLRKHKLTLTTLKKIKSGKEDAENQYECPVCFQGFQNASSYSSHLLRKHKLSLTALKNMANGKEDVFTQEEEEQEEQTQTKEFECPICFNKFQKPSTYSSHVFRKHNLTLTKLKQIINGDDDGGKMRAQKQKQSISEEHDYANSQLVGEEASCEVDVEKSATAAKDSDDEAPTDFVECTKYCHKMIPAMEILAHERSHLEKLQNAAAATTSIVKEDRKYICSFCCQEFKSELYVKLHEKKVHLRDIESERKECPICKKKFEKRYLKSHISNVHTDGQKFPCEICGDLFKSNLSLKNHRKLHMDRKYQCSMCDKGFLRPAVLKVHMRSHTGEEPYICHICEQRFKTKIRLDYHLQRHAGVKHYCKVCNKEFNFADQLRVHSYKHTGMPYQCTICEYKTGQREKFISHLRKRHDKTMTYEELAEMFKKNTGRYPRVSYAKPVKTTDDAKQEAEVSN